MSCTITHIKQWFNLPLSHTRFLQVKLYSPSSRIATVLSWSLANYSTMGIWTAFTHSDLLLCLKIIFCWWCLWQNHSEGVFKFTSFKMSGKVALKVSPIKRIGGEEGSDEDDWGGLGQTDILVVDHIDRGYKEPPVPREFCNIALPSSSYLHQQQDSHCQQTFQMT